MVGTRSTGIYSTTTIASARRGRERRRGRGRGRGRPGLGLGLGRKKTEPARQLIAAPVLVCHAKNQYRSLRLTKQLDYNVDSSMRTESTSLALALALGSSTPTPTPRQSSGGR